MWNPDGKKWREMPKALIAPFSANAAKTKYTMVIKALIGASVLIFVVPLISWDKSIESLKEPKEVYVPRIVKYK